MQKIRLIAFVFFVLAIVNNINATTFVAKAYGKWSDPKVWSENQPAGNVVFQNDSVIIESDVLVDNAIEIEGTLLIKKNGKLMGNKPIVINRTGLYKNLGNGVYKNILNEGLIENEMIIESNADFENYGVVKNNNAIFSSSSIYNNGGYLDGNKGEYYAQNKFINSNNGTIGENVKMYVAEKNEKESVAATNNLAKKTINLQAELYKGNNVSLTVMVGDAKVDFFKIERSYNGIDFKEIGEFYVENTLPEYKIYEEKDAKAGLVWYRVRPISSEVAANYLPTISMKIR